MLDSGRTEKMTNDQRMLISINTSVKDDLRALHLVINGKGKVNGLRNIVI